jgi:hypothetical protein
VSVELLRVEFCDRFTVSYGRIALSLGLKARRIPLLEQTASPPDCQYRCRLSPISYSKEQQQSPCLSSTQQICCLTSLASPLNPMFSPSLVIPNPINLTVLLTVDFSSAKIW